MQQSQQRKPKEANIPTIFLKGFYIEEETEQLHFYEEIETPLLLVEHITSFKENVFWVKIKNLWVLIGKIPPLKIEPNDIVLFQEKGKWGLFRYLGEEKEKVILQDGKEQRKTKVDKDVLEKLNFFGKVLRVQEKI
ncbi:MAG: hypothetical protein GXO22_03555 [Aquificae bacterium]|nr:hypothetical protein [Aquificota bacterium]